MIAFDVETHLIRFVQRNGKQIGSTMLAPRLVCSARASVGGNLCASSRVDSLTWLRATLRSESVIVGHNVAYDLGVCAAEDPSLLPPIFRALDAGRIRDTKIRQRLLDIADGLVQLNGKEFVHTGSAPRAAVYSLSDLSDLWLGKSLEKEDTWRLRYSELDGTDIALWPPEARGYVLQDAQTTLEIFQKQPEPVNEIEQVRAAFALHLISLWGMRTDPRAVADLRARLEKDCLVVETVAKDAGLVRPDGTKDLSAIRTRIADAFRANYEEPPRTPKGSVSTSTETLLASGDSILIALGESQTDAKVLSTYVPVLEARAVEPVGCRYQVLVASGRTSSSKPNDQNPPRAGGVRECYVPRPGNVFVACDYDTLELRAWAQVLLDLFGWSKLADALRAGEDLHLSLASQIIGISLEESATRYRSGDAEIAMWRQHAKMANFGFPGGMKPPRFVQACADQGSKIDLDTARKLYAGWCARWPEYKNYFEHINKLCGAKGSAQMTQLRSMRKRGNVRYCEAANSYFQGLAADGAKAALYAVQREAYSEEASALYGSRTVAFLHDEIMMESPESLASVAAERLQAVMVREMKHYLPDIPVSASPVLMRRWYKGAKAVRAGGSLVPSKPVVSDGKTTWIVD